MVRLAATRQRLVREPDALARQQLGRAARAAEEHGRRPARVRREADRAGRARGQGYSASALIGRLMSSRTACGGGRPSYSTRYTTSHSGMSTPAWAVTARMAPAAW